jgi:hypothetical protein
MYLLLLFARFVCLCAGKTISSFAKNSINLTPPLPPPPLSEQRGRHPLRQEPELRRRDPGY